MERPVKVGGHVVVAGTLIPASNVAQRQAASRSGAGAPRPSL